MVGDTEYQEDERLRKIEASGREIIKAMTAIQDLNNRITTTKQNLAELEAQMVQAQLDFQIFLQRDAQLRIQHHGR